jgi:hypothetical protein
MVTIGDSLKEILDLPIANTFIKGNNLYFVFILFIQSFYEQAINKSSSNEELKVGEIPDKKIFLKKILNERSDALSPKVKDIIKLMFTNVIRKSFNEPKKFLLMYTVFLTLCYRLFETQKALRDFFAALLKSQRSLLNTFESRLWCRFFLLSVFVTMYLNDLQRSDFYSTIGLDTKQFDQHVIRKTNQSSGTLFPVILDVDNPDFFNLLDLCAECNVKLINLEKENISEFSKTIQKLPLYLDMVTNLLKLYFLPTIETKYIWTEN